MAKRYVIVTLNDDTNYGNRLQNYALQKLLSEYGDTVTAFCTRFRKKSAWIVRIFYRSLKSTVLLGVRSRKPMTVFKRYLKCRKFTKEYVPDSKVSIDVLHGLRPKSYSSDTFVFGSDQIWNYSNYTAEDKLPLFSLYFGDFLPQDACRVSYAASIGVAALPPSNVQSVFKEYLPKFKAISVREYAGERLVHEMTDLDAQVVLDPTLMLNQQEWRSITEGFVADDEKYVLTYFLGMPSDEQVKSIKEYAKKNKCLIRSINNLDDPNTYTAGPQDFVELFSKAYYVFTDSYHACCFSIIFHRQFSVYTRAGLSSSENMNSRMETLFKLFDLDSVVLEKGIAPEIDYNHVDKRLASLRRVSASWLNEALRM